ncbi:MAG: hypothetical protein D3917_04255 [Candidatus Electrothrix sp. AX5]|nr:hypothetical protein [Candidatus Electrothrix sp. AX5]
MAEYLVAEAAVEGTHRDADGRRIDRFALFEHRNDDRWNVVIFLWAGLASLMDVEAFIELCDATEDIPLGYGILDDQYDNFPTEVKRRLLLRFIQLKPKVDEGKRAFFWGCSYAASSGEISLHAQSIEFRGLSGRYSQLGGSLIDNAVSDRLLFWADAKGTRGRLRRMIWASVALHSPNLQDWTACIKQLPTGLRPPDNNQWLFWLAWKMNHKFINEPTAHIERVLTV